MMGRPTQMPHNGDKHRSLEDYGDYLQWYISVFFLNLLWMDDIIQRPTQFI